MINKTGKNRPDNPGEKWNIFFQRWNRNEQGEATHTVDMAWRNRSRSFYYGGSRDEALGGVQGRSPANQSMKNCVFHAGCGIVRVDTYKHD